MRELNMAHRCVNCGSINDMARFEDEAFTMECAGMKARVAGLLRLAVQDYG